MAAGRVVRVGAKGRVEGQRGLPKPAVPLASITAAGVAGDHNVWRSVKRPGDLDMAVLLMTAEALAAIRAEGWPVQPGDIGENLTTEGVPYEAFQPGTRWRAGTALLEVSKRCDPCTNLYMLPYVGPARGPAFLRALVGRRGWYLRVLAEGEVRPGDAIAPA
jgi:MOSC domain-containing protein YiiM